MAFNFVQTIFFIYVLVVRTCAASHEEECLALFEFKQSILHQPYASFNVDGFQKLDSWRRLTSNASDHDSDCCLWDGVVCSDNGYVIRLDLSRSSLHGPIKPNSSLFNLVHLEMLNLSMNNFVGSEIPFEIGRLKQLKSLDLSNSRFSGQIPIEISHLMQLTSLDLSANPLKLQRGGFEYMVQNLSRLEEFNLLGVDISSSVPSFLANISSLRLIILFDCRLQGEFPSAIFHLPKLKFLSMAENPNLNGFIPEFQNNTLLEHVNLYATSFAGSIPESISKLKHLEFLSLDENYLSGCIPRSLSNITQLVYLTLGQEDLLMGVDPSLPNLLPNSVGLEICEKGHAHEWIGKLTNLEEVHLFHVNINDEILPSLTNLTKLSILEMRECAIYGNIPSSFMNLTNIKVFALPRNQLQGQISSFFSNFQSLEYLNVMENNFSGTLDLDTFIGFTKLEALLLDNNIISFVETNNQTNGALLPALDQLGLSSCNLIKFPSFLQYQKKLSTLYLPDNKIEGLVPEWFLKNTKETLQILDLSYNSITGFHQHYHFLPWVRLQAFRFGDNQLRGPLPIPPPTTIIYDISNNNLIGEIPPSICAVKSLQVLDLSSNNMAGILPSCFCNLSNSLYLDLKRNNFHGPMINSFSHESPIEQIDLSENNFTGKISKSLANCTNLKVLVLGGNSFVDIFPFWLGTLPKLQVLVLRSNKFHGAIHDLTTIGSQFPKLKILDLSNNGFNHQLDDKFFQKLNALRYSSVQKMEPEVYIQNQLVSYSVPYSMTLTNKGAKREYANKVLNIFTAIDLSCNNFEGQIPQSLGDLLGLESLNLSNNHFSGHVLPFLGNLKNLESLDLSQNKLSGEIPHELSQLNFLEIFNVSFNNLHGRIPQGKQFNTFDENSYMGNPNLCGEVLYKECQNSQPSILVPTGNESVSLLPTDGVDFIIISLGAASGLVIGIILGNLLYARYNDWFVERFKLRKDKWVRPLSNKRKN